MLSLLSLTLLINEAVAAPVDFDTQVMPILTKAGCNTGACHGAAAGRGGFHLSLYGSRPERDFNEIVLALEGRRINRRNSENSLLLQKPTEQLNHEGGTRIDMDSADFGMLKQWIDDGANRLRRRKLERFQVAADVDVVTDLNRSVQLTALAIFSDGTEQNVSPWTVFSPEDPASVSIDESGLTEIRRRGRHVIVARYLDRVQAIELIAPMSDATAMHDVVDISIDGFVEHKLSQVGIKAAEPADDATIIRRLFLDLAGRLPTPKETLHYLNDERPEKKNELVDRLLTSPAFTEFWTFRFAKLMRVDGRKSNAKSMEVYYRWLREAVAADKPFDWIAEQLLLAEGSVQETGPANFYAVTGDARSHAEFTSRVFLGVRLQCANCHDHPLDSWTQDDYHGLSAIFAKVKRGPVIRVAESGEVIHPGTGEPAVPKIPGQPFSADAAADRVRLTRWIVSEENPYFARAIVNRLWSYLMGRGLVEPVDDHRHTNPATHPELLKWLTEDFVDHGMHLRHTIRKICTSDTYARKTAAESSVLEFYASAVSKPVAAEVLLDAVVDVTGFPDVHKSRAISLDGMKQDSRSLALLSGCAPGDACEASVADTDDLSVQLHLLNGPLLNERISSPNGSLNRQLSKGLATDEIVETFYLRAYSRKPDKRELSFWSQQFAGSDDNSRVKSVAEDFLWSLLTSTEFTVNH